MEAKNVRGKVFLVTGGAMGMGKLVAERFARDGAKVVIWDMNSEALAKTEKEFTDKGYEVYTAVVDVSDREKVYQEAEKVKKEVGSVDVLMNNAGIVRAAPFLDTKDEDDFNTLNINFIAQMWTCKAFLPDMVASNDGHVITLASAAAITPVPGAAAYASSKAAALMFVNTLRWELKNAGKSGVKFTAICPTAVTTGMFEGCKPPLLNPWLEPDYMADKIYAAYHKNKTTVLEPLIAKFTPLMNALMPEPVAYFAGKILKLSTMFDNWVGH
jgi:all-trans-retinol dehydrogenase (NAD+)